MLEDRRRLDLGLFDGVIRGVFICNRIRFGRDQMNLCLRGLLRDRRGGLRNACETDADPDQ